jgi:hypothetical protein
MSDDWTPLVTLDLETASANAFAEVVRKFREMATAMPPLGPLDIETGWHTVYPEMAEEFLRRNDGNRKVSVSTVRKYAYSMLMDDWRETGQPLIFNTDGKMEDAQHRCWACYLSGASFKTLIVTDVKPQADLFAYIDDVKPRSAADALYTSGLDGISSHLAKAAQLSWRYDHKGVGVVTQPRTVQALNNREVLNYVRDHRGLNDVAQWVNANYPDAVKLIWDRAVAFFFAWRINEQCGSEALDDFLLQLTNESKLEADSAIAGLASRLQRDTGTLGEKMKDGHRLALLIKAFALHRAGKKVGKTGLALRDNEKYPRFEDLTAAPVADAAE